MYRCQYGHFSIRFVSFYHNLYFINQLVATMPPDIYLILSKENFVLKIRTKHLKKIFFYYSKFKKLRLNTETVINKRFEQMSTTIINALTHCESTHSRIIEYNKLNVANQNAYVTPFEISDRLRSGSSNPQSFFRTYFIFFAILLVANPFNICIPRPSRIDNSCSLIAIKLIGTKMSSWLTDKVNHGKIHMSISDLSTKRLKREIYRTVYSIVNDRKFNFLDYPSQYIFWARRHCSEKIQLSPT
ncbi:hypothetical protein AGLY_013753 [Aphis glycines]|uniref:Uncharacterized protein n=1 Tax=Aphis glycines TaxID=307491 RepID=A0A6G0T6A4_APHGL|nr:hypothetical protein AGLY_013753 [Aphis glycines]